MTAPVDPLSRLVADDDVVDRELLASVLEDKIRLDRAGGTFAFLTGARRQLNNRQQVVVALLAQKALHLLDEQHSDALSPAEIELRTGVKSNTLRPILKLFSDARVIRQNSARAYYVPAYSIEDAARLLAPGEN